MAVAEQEKSENGVTSGATGAALKAAAAAAATGAATYAVKKVRSHDSGSKDDGEGSSERKSKKSRGGSQSLLATAAATSWDAAADVLLPMAEDAAEAAGKYLATHGPDVVRERIVPAFIEAFNDAA